jgi:hypothetical protein
MPFHLNMPAAKRHALHLEPKSLLERMLARNADGSPRPDHTMPGQPRKRAQRPNYLPRGSRETRGGSDLPIGSHLPSRDLPNRVREND